MKKIFIIIIVVLLIFLLGITIYKIKIDDNKTVDSKFISYKIENIKKDLIVDDVLDKEKFQDKIITDKITTINYTYFDNKKSVVGRIYFDSNNNLNIFNENENYSLKISDIKFETMYKKDYNYNEIYVFLISENKDLYYLKINSNDIRKSELIKIELSYNVNAFVNIDFTLDKYKSANTVFVLSSDGNIYDILSNIRYDKNIKSLYNKFYVYNDNTISNIFGNILENDKGEYYKLKYVFSTFDDNNFTGKNTILIITENNKLIYISQDNNNLYEYTKKIKELNFDAKYPYIKSKLNITFDDNYKISLNAECNQYYCINDFSN